MTNWNWKTTVCGLLFGGCTYIMTSGDFDASWKKWAGLGAAMSGTLMGVSAADAKKPKP